MANRYFTTEIAAGMARITGADAEHLCRVLRAKPGQKLTLCDGAGVDYEAVITAADKDEVLLEVVSSASSAGEASIDAIACIAMAKGERMDYAVQKAVELGAARILPFYSAHTVVKPKNEAEKQRRFTRIAAEAAKQSGRGRLPQVAAPVSFAEMLRAAAGCDLALFAYEVAGCPLAEALDGFGQSGAAGRRPSAAVISGPEGGFAPAEAEAAKAAGCRLVHLGPRILRCETAPAVLLTALMLLTGNLQ